MSSTVERNQRILAGYRAGRTIPDLALTEEVDPQVVRRVLLADPTWLAAEYETKSARLGRAEGQIAPASAQLTMAAAQASSAARATPSTKPSTQPAFRRARMATGRRPRRSHAKQPSVSSPSTRAAGRRRTWLRS